MPKVGKLIIEGSNAEGDDVWDDVCSMVDSVLNDMKDTPTRWNAIVKNFGWRKVDGRRDNFEADTASSLITSVLPECECSFKIYHYGRKGFAINNAHHDSPTWDEWYYITPAKVVANA